MDAFAEPALAPEAPSEAAKEARYRALIQVGRDQADRGELIRVDDIRAWLDGLGQPRDPA